jgi:hypothetical protein
VTVLTIEAYALMDGGSIREMCWTSGLMTCFDNIKCKPIRSCKVLFFLGPHSSFAGVKVLKSSESMPVSLFYCYFVMFSRCTLFVFAILSLFCLISQV